MDWTGELADRMVPAAEAQPLSASGLAGVLVVALVAIAWWPAWRVLRLAVTLVHELGHAAVGVAFGRRFTGFVLRDDMSGQAVTVGRASGPGLVAMTWAGYPAPAVVGAGLVWASVHGWAAPVLTLALLALVVALAYVRSVLTAVIVLASLAAVGSLWWGRDDGVQQHVLVGAGIILLVGAWRHLGVVLGDRNPRSDPGSLARATGVPSAVWQASFALVCGLASWVVATEVYAVLRA